MTAEMNEPTNPTARPDDGRSRVEGIGSSNRPTQGVGVGSEPAPFSLSEMQAEVGAWHREQFRDIDPLACLLKAMSELGELADIDCAALENQAGDLVGRPLAIQEACGGPFLALGLFMGEGLPQAFRPGIRG